MQARALSGEPAVGMIAVLRQVHAESGVGGLFQGLIPRMGTNVWLTLFLVSGANIVKQCREGSTEAICTASANPQHHCA